MILSAFLKSLSQLSDSRFRKVLWMGIGLTVALLFGSYAGLLWLIEWLTGESMTLPLVGEVTWVGDLLSIGSLVFMIVLSAFLMIPVASAITSMFLDEVAQAVEDRHYPSLPPATPVPFADAARDTVSFLGILIGANLVAFVLYVFFPPATPFIFWGMNGFLLGREYFTLAAMRRIGREGARENLLVPILGAATFTHIYHALSRR